MFPFIALSSFLLTPGAFDFEGVLSQLEEVPLLLGSLFYYVVAIVSIEIVFRVFYTIYEFFKSEDERAGGTVVSEPVEVEEGEEAHRHNTEAAREMR